VSKSFTQRLRDCIVRRDTAGRLAGQCECCGSEQVQLVDWLGENFKYRCRKCTREWYIKPSL